MQLLPEADEVYVLCRSTGRGQKERAMRRRWLRQLIGDLRSLRRRVREGQLKQREFIQRALGRLQERHPQAWHWLKWELTETERAQPDALADPGSVGADRAGRSMVRVAGRRRMCLPRIMQPEPAQAVLLEQLNWGLPQQPPPRVYAQDMPSTRARCAHRENILQRKP